MQNTDIPQASSLDRVRHVVQAVADGATTRKLVTRVTGISPRHVGYSTHAARILDWLLEHEGALSPTDRGKQLLETTPDSAGELRALRDAVTRSYFIKDLAPDLLDVQGVGEDLLASRIVARTSLAPATARRRAQCLLAWRRRLIQSRLSLAEPAPERLPPWSHVPAQDGAKLRGVDIERYGPLRRARVALGPVTVMIGTNATGKSTFMDSVAFVAEALNSDVETALRQRATQLEDLLWFGQGDDFGFGFEFALPADVVSSPGRSVARYELAIGRLGDGSAGVVSEALYLRPDGAVADKPRQSKTPKGWKRVLAQTLGGNGYFTSEAGKWNTQFPVGNHKLALAALQEDRKRFPAANRLRDMLRTGVHRLALNPEAVARPSSPLGPRGFRPDGSNLPLVVRSLQERDEQRFHDWVDHVREALPDLESLRVAERPEDRHAYLVARYRGGLELPAWRLSDGTLRILALTLLSYASTPDSLFLVEEPENGVHPGAVEAVYQALSSPYDAQILVATHSPVLLSVVPREDLLCFLRDGSQTTIVAGTDHPALRQWQRGADLSVLFASGVLD